MSKKDRHGKFHIRKTKGQNALSTRTIKALLHTFTSRTILVVGDVMLDEFIWGEVVRISPEAPVPVVQGRRRTYTAGGAANVAANLVSLGGQVILHGIIGKDEAAAHLCRLLADQSVDPSNLFPDPSRPTTIKTRIVAQNQQVVRVDWEECKPLDEQPASQFLHLACASLQQCDLMILSDYGKGTISPKTAAALIQQARTLEKPVIVDPKGLDYVKYRGTNLITPNQHEAQLAAHHPVTNEQELQEAAAILQQTLEGSSIIVTRGAAGMAVFVSGQPAVMIPAAARQVFDVTGAGDTVVAALALALASGADLVTAARLANTAAGIVVGKVGTAVVALDELEKANGNRF